MRPGSRTTTLSAMGAGEAQGHSFDPMLRSAALWRKYGSQGAAASGWSAERGLSLRCRPRSHDQRPIRETWATR
jgi:hypothetical protein